MGKLSALNPLILIPSFGLIDHIYFSKFICVNEIIILYFTN